MVDCSTKAKRVFLTCFFWLLFERSPSFFMVSKNLRIVKFFFVGRGMRADMEVTDPLPTGYGTRFFLCEIEKAVIYIDHHSDK